MQPGTKSFSIKNGTCHLFADRIEIQQNDLFGAIGSFLFKRGIQNAIGIYLLAFIALTGGTLLSLFLDNYFLTAFLATMSLFSIYLIIRRRRASFVPIVSRQQIIEVVYKKAVQGVSRAYFDIYFSPKEGKKPLQRRVSLPNRIHNGASIADTAYWMMRDEGLVS